MKKKLNKYILIILTLTLSVTLIPASVFAGTYEFDPSGASKNPFNPRGYMVEVNGASNWISSRFDNSGSMPYYTGGYNGIDYIDAEEAGTLYALTDRNPTPGKNYLQGYKDGVPISGFSSAIGAPNRANIATTGNSSGWAIPITVNWEPGSVYEFCFLRGMQANNGITLVFSPDGKGYIWNIETAEERAKYNQDRYSEYQFIVSYEKETDEETGENKYFNFYMVPMRFTVRTYADISAWAPAVAEAREFYNSITYDDLRFGKYSRANVEALGQMIDDFDYEVQNVVRKKIQSEADARLASMISELEDMIRKTKTEKPEPSDVSKLNKLIDEGNKLYAKASANVGIDIGQYGEFEVQQLGNELKEAKAIDKYMEQGEINRAANELEAAILAVRKSLRLEEQLYFYDKATGIYVIAPLGSLPEDAILYVRRMDKESDEFKAIEGKLSEKETEAVYYSVQFYKDEFQIQPKETVEVQVPIDPNISQNSSTMYFVGKGGELNKIETVKADGMHIFKTGVISDMVMTGSTATEEDKAAQRGENMKEIINQTQEEQAEDNKEIELAKEKQKKEEYKDPLDKLLKRSANTATFSNDVRRETNPLYLMAIAGVLGVAAAIIGLRGVREIRKRDK